jgi:glycogen debranching enzyme
MFVLLLSELWHWTGDSDVLRRHRDVALRGLEWAERYGDLDGDGFLEYRTRSSGGLRNQGWKDSDEAIRHTDGRIAEVPIATVEEQAFHYLALQRMAEILLELDEAERAESFLARAAKLRVQWHDAFWMQDEGFYALALDGRKDQVRSISSNPGHALATGIVPAEHARSVADRLLAQDMFSGWGIRTLSDRHRSYNPFAYHLGTVWPVEQATFVLGFKRYGLDDHVVRLGTAVLEAACEANEKRLPEALTGHARSSYSRPIPYPQACSPQAWSASATIQLIQIMLGLYPFAPLGMLALVRPRLPEWLPELTLRRLRVGRAAIDLRFVRNEDGSASHEVLNRRGRLLVIPAGPPESADQQESLLEGLAKAGLTHLPGTRARAARIALGLE